MNGKSLLLICVAISLIVAAVAFREYATLDALVARERLLQQAIQSHPVSSLLVAFAVYVVAALVPGTAGKSLVYGWLFGMVWGVVLVNGALTIAAIVTFLFSRRVFGDALWSRFGYSLVRVNQGFEREGGFYLLLLRLIHAPYTFVNYAMGATRVRVRTFWWATQLGLLPGNVVWVYAGSRFPSLQDIAHGGARQVWSPDVVLALLLVALFPFAVRAAVRWWGRKRSAADSTPA